MWGGCVGVEMCVGVCVLGDVGERVLDKWHSLHIYTHYKHEYSELLSI